MASPRPSDLDLYKLRLERRLARLDPGACESFRRGEINLLAALRKAETRPAASHPWRFHNKPATPRPRQT
jgi:hypothetical protein